MRVINYGYVIMISLRKSGRFLVAMHCLPLSFAELIQRIVSSMMLYTSTWRKLEKQGMKML